MVPKESCHHESSTLAFHCASLSSCLGVLCDGCLRYTMRRGPLVVYAEDSDLARAIAVPLTHCFPENDQRRVLVV